MGLGTARGGCQFCKLDVQMGSIPVRSTYTDIAQSGEHFPYKEGAGSSILPVSIKRVCSVKVAHVLWEHVEPFESDIFDSQGGLEMDPALAHTQNDTGSNPVPATYAG